MLKRFEMINKKVTTLNEFIIQSQKGFPFATGELTGLLSDIGFAAKLVNREVNKAGLVDILGTTGDNNVHGEEVKKLDVFAHEKFIDALRMSGECSGVASEESDDFIAFDTAEHGRNAKYVVCMDPLDGSSNIDVNVSIGTIFAVYRRITESGPCQLEDFLQPGKNLVAAGYVLYGSSTMLVYTTGTRVNGFTLDPSVGEFFLSHRDIRVPENGGLYSINEGYYKKYTPALKDYIAHCKSEDNSLGKPLSARYIGSMVADIHRNLIKGGIYIYPAMQGVPNGKLRLLYECNPMAFIIENAGGMATDGHRRILDIEPTELHQRRPIYIGSKNMVEKAEWFIQKSEILKGAIA